MLAAAAEAAQSAAAAAVRASLMAALLLEGQLAAAAGMTTLMMVMMMMEVMTHLSSRHAAGLLAWVSLDPQHPLLQQHPAVACILEQLLVVGHVLVLLLALP